MDPAPGARRTSGVPAPGDHVGVALRVTPAHVGRPSARRPCAGSDAFGVALRLDLRTPAGAAARHFLQDLLNERLVVREHQYVVLLQLDAGLGDLLLRGRHEQEGTPGPLRAQLAAGSCDPVAAGLE